MSLRVFWLFVLFSLCGTAQADAVEKMAGVIEATIEGRSVVLAALVTLRIAITRTLGALFVIAYVSFVWSAY